MTNLRRNTAGHFGLLSGTIGLALCIGQTHKGHVDTKHERERMQEMHEQKMHYLHEFHRQQLHAKDHLIAAMGAEKRTVEAERLAEGYSQKVRQHERREGGRGGEEPGEVMGLARQEDKEREVWRIMGAARQEDDGGGGDGDGRGGREG